MGDEDVNGSSGSTSWENHIHPATAYSCLLNTLREHLRQLWAAVRLWSTSWPMSSRMRSVVALAAFYTRCSGFMGFNKVGWEGNQLDLVSDGDLETSDPVLFVSRCPSVAPSVISLDGCTCLPNNTFKMILLEVFCVCI